MKTKTAKPLFVPVYTVFYEQFKKGSKSIEYRTYGPRWNEKTCWVGRTVVVSKGYGKKDRLNGIVEQFDHVGSVSQIYIKLQRKP